MCRTTLFINSITIIEIETASYIIMTHFINAIPCISGSRPILENLPEYLRQ